MGISKPGIDGQGKAGHRGGRSQPVLEAKLLAKFQAALSSDMIDYLVVATNEMLRHLHGTTTAGDPHHHPGAAGCRAPAVEPRRVRGEENLSSPRLRDEIRARERRLAELDQQLEGLRGATRPMPRQIDRAWIDAQVQSPSELLARDPVGARQQIQKHVEELRVSPAPDAGDPVVRITGQVKVDGLLGGEEAVPSTIGCGGPL